MIAHTSSTAQSHAASLEIYRNFILLLFLHICSSLVFKRGLNGLFKSSLFAAWNVELESFVSNFLLVDLLELGESKGELMRGEGCVLVLVEGREVSFNNKDRIALLADREQECWEVEVTYYLRGDCVGAVQVEPCAVDSPYTEPVAVAVADEPTV